MYYSALLLILLVAIVSAISPTGPNVFQRVNSTTKTSSSNKVTAKSARSDYPHHGGYEHHYPHHYGGGHLGGFGHHKELDHYILPMLLMLGLGVLLMPLVSLMMGTMVGNVPVTTLVSGRKKREAVAKPVADKTILDLWKKIGKAIEVFTKND